MIARAGRRSAAGTMMAALHMATVALLVATVALLAVVAASPAAAQEEPTIEAVASDAYLPRNVEVAEEWTLIRDATGDLVDPAGTPVADGPGWLDATAVLIADTRLNRPFFNFIGRNHGEADAATWRSREADQLEPGDRVLVIVVDLAEPIPETVDGDLQLIVGTDNDERAWPILPGAFASADHGNRVVTANGIFDGDDGPRVLARATDLVGQDPAATPERDNARYRAVGWISRGRDRIVHVQRTLGRPPTAALRLVGDAGGQRFADIIGPAPRIPLADPVPALAITCTALGVFPGGADTDAADTDTADPGASDPSGPIEIRVAFEGPDVGELPAEASITVELLAAGSEAPFPTVGRLTTDPDRGAATIASEAPPQRYLDITLGALDGAASPPIDLRRLIGTGGVDAGTGTFGVAAGDPRCAELDASEGG